MFDGDVLADRIVLVRVQAGKAAIVAGPLKPTQYDRGNRIPDEVERLFSKASTFELYSLDPEQKFGKDGKIIPGKENFHDYEVRSKTEVKGEAERKRLVDALRLGAEDNYGMAAACFIPHHGLRLKGDGKTVDLVICFQCLQVYVFVNGERKGGFLTTHDPQKAFDAVLKVANVQAP